MSKLKAVIFTFALIGFGAYFFIDQSSHKQFNAFRIAPNKTPEENITKKTNVSASSKTSSRPREIASIKKTKTERRPAQRGAYSADDLQARERAEKFLELQRARRASTNRKKVSFDFLNERGEGHTLMPDLHAVPVSEGEIRDAQIVSGHYIVPGAPGSHSYHVVKTERGTYAVFTGVIKVMHDKGADPYQIANDFGGEVSEVYDHINSVYLKYHDYGQALKAHEGLAGAVGIKSAQLEVLEHGRQAR